MQFPIFHTPMAGNGLTIAADAVTHVVISHGVAIGLFGLIVLVDAMAYRKKSQAWDDLARAMLKFATIVIPTVGAITGVGIWFFTSALAPRGIGSMLRVFFWPWFTEWLVFAAEVVTLLIFYYGWEAMAQRRHMRSALLGTTYLVLAGASALLITGILSFMLTPDDWPYRRTFANAYLNPTFAPHLVLRLAAAFVLGSVFAFLVLFYGHVDPQARREAAPVFGTVMIIALVFIPAYAIWYYAAVPLAFRTNAVGAVLPPVLGKNPALFWTANGLGTVSLFGVALLARYGKLEALKRASVPALVVAAAFVAEFEYTREFIRGPYLMPGYMYANQVLMTERPYLTQTGMLASAPWARVSTAPMSVNEAGRYLFGANCSVCHTVDGVNGIRQRVRGRSEDGLYVLIGHTHDLLPWMAPFSGSDRERHALAQYLYGLASVPHPSRGEARFVTVPASHPVAGGARMLTPDQGGTAPVPGTVPATVPGGGR